MMKLIKYTLPTFSCIILWMLLTIPDESQAKISLNQIMKEPIACGTGQPDGSYCEPPRCTCVANAHCTNSVCQCDTGFVEVDWTCKPVCGTGYLDGSYCELPRCDCIVNAECNENDFCECAAGYVDVDGECKPECGTGEVDGSYCETGRCDCIVNAFCNGTAGCECDTGFTDVDGKCLPECGTGELDGSYCETGRCDCIVNAVCNGTADCECDTGFTDVDGECLPECGTGELDGSYCETRRCDCIVNAVCNGAAGCECDTDFTDVDGECLPECTELESHSCVVTETCLPAFRNTGGTCASGTDVCCGNYTTEFVIRPAMAYNWVRAKELCENEGGQIATFKNAEERAEIAEFANDANVMKNYFHWVGAKVESSTVWKFYDDTPFVDNVQFNNYLFPGEKMFADLASASANNCLMVYFIEADGRVMFRQRSCTNIAAAVICLIGVPV